MRVAGPFIPSSPQRSEISGGSAGARKILSWRLWEKSPARGAYATGPLKWSALAGPTASSRSALTSNREL
jgi:hypothetical protein